MTKQSHPFKGSFDPERARWQPVPTEDGMPGALEVGYADDGMVALRRAADPDGDLLIYSSSEWKAFTEGVRDGEFDLDTWGDEPGGQTATS